MQNRIFAALWLFLATIFSAQASNPHLKSSRPDSLSPEVFLQFVQKTAEFLDSLDAQSSDPAWIAQRGWYLSTEQDFLNVIAPNEDRNYSMGLAIGFLGPNTSRDYLVLPVLRRWIDCRWVRCS